MVINILAVRDTLLHTVQVTQESQRHKNALENLVKRCPVTKLQFVNGKSEKPLHLKTKCLQLYEMCCYT